MKKLNYILSLLFISTGYIFSQTEENKIIKEDTIIKIDTIIIIEDLISDTVILAEPKSGQDKQTDLSKYYFYKDYLSFLKKNNSTNDADTLLNLGKSINIISLRASVFLFGLIGSFVWDIPAAMIKSPTTVSISGFTGTAGDPGGGGFSFSGVGVGLSVKSVKSKNFIIKYNIRPGVMFGDPKVSGPCFDLGVDFIFFKIISISPGVLGAKKNVIPTISLGLNYIY